MEKNNIIYPAINHSSLYCFTQVLMLEYASAMLCCGNKHIKILTKILAPPNVQSLLNNVMKDAS
jgi:hypothetical protein